jgi:hypothetical protein
VFIFKGVLSDFKKSMSDDLATISSRISSLEAGHRVSLPTPCEEVSDLIYRVGTAHGGRAQVCTGGIEGPGKQYPYEKTGGLEPGRFKPTEEPGAEEKDPVVFTGR